MCDKVMVINVSKMKFDFQRENNSKIEVKILLFFITRMKFGLNQFFKFYVA